MCWKGKEKGIGLSVGSGCEIGEVGKSEGWERKANRKESERRKEKEIKAVSSKCRKAAKLCAYAAKRIVFFEGFEFV